MILEEPRELEPMFVGCKEAFDKVFERQNAIKRANVIYTESWGGDKLFILQQRCERHEKLHLYTLCI